MRNINLRYVDEAYDENGLLTRFDITMPDNFNFAYDVVDDIAINDPERTAMVWCNPEGEEHVFTFADMKTWSDKTANFLADCGIGRGDFVMVILRRHYQFWFTMLALEKLGAVAVPATFMLKEHDLTYRLNGADIKAIIATSAGDIADTIDAVVEECPSVETLILVNPAGAGLTPRDGNGNWVAPAGELVGEALSGPAGICAAPVAREGWRDFNSEVRAASADFTRRETAGADPMLMYFSSGTSGNPKMVLHDSGYALAHLITAKHWHNVNPEGLHFTIADTGWGKAVWGKFFGQWLMEAAVLTYDFDRYDPAEILSLVGRYGVTTLCCPPTMYRLMTEVDVDAFDLSSLEYCTTAGEALNPDLFDFWREHTGLTIYEGFGQTETPLTVGNLTNSTPRPGSMGKPVPMYVMKVLREDGTECDTGETGEMVRGPQRRRHQVERLPHRPRRDRVGHARARRRARGGRHRRARSGARLRREGDGGACRRLAGKRRAYRRAAEVGEAPDGPLQVPAHHRVRRRAAPHRQRQDSPRRHPRAGQDPPRLAEDPRGAHLMTAGASTGLPFPLEPVVVVTGHYGVGKTNFALNLALDAAAAGYRATLADMDVVNPYFRSNEYRDLLEGAGARLIAPVFGHTGTSLDVPSVTGELAVAAAEAYRDETGRTIVIVDAGGDDVGATTLARFAPALAAGPYAMLYVVNAFRNLTQTSADAVAVLREIEAKSHLEATAVVGNSHLQGETTMGHIAESVPYTQAVASMAGLPVACITAPIQAIQRENTGSTALSGIPML